MVGSLYGSSEYTATTTAIIDDGTTPHTNAAPTNGTVDATHHIPLIPADQDCNADAAAVQRQHSAPAAPPSLLSIDPSTLNERQLCQHILSLFLCNHFIRAQQLASQYSTKYIRTSLLHCYFKTIEVVATQNETDMASTLALIWQVEAAGSKYGSRGTVNDKLTGQLIQGDTYLLGGMVQLLQESYVKGLWNVRKGYNFIEKAYAQLHNKDGSSAVSTSGMTDDERIQHVDNMGWSNFGNGYVNLLMSLLPPVVLKLISFVGFGSGNRQLGLQSLQHCYDSPSLFQPFGALMLINYNVNITPFLGVQNKQHLQQAQELVDWGLKHYNHSVLFEFMYSRLERGNRNLDHAQELAQDALKRCAEFPALSVLIWYQLGWLGTFSLNWMDSAQAFEHLLQPTFVKIHDDGTRELIDAADTGMGDDVDDGRVDTLTHGKIISVQRPAAGAAGFYAYHIAVAYACAGNDAKMREAATAVPKWCSKRQRQKPLEVYARNRAEEMLQWPTVQTNSGPQLLPLLYAIELLFLWNGFSTMPISKIHELQQSLHAAVASDRPAPGSLHATFASVYDATIEHNLGNKAKASDILLPLEQALPAIEQREKRSKQSNFLHALLHLEMATLDIDNGNAADARRHSKAAQKSQDFELTNIVHIKLHALDDKIAALER